MSRARWPGLEPLAERRFRALWTAGLISWYGDYLTVPALVLVSFRLGGALAVGLLFIFQTTPMVVLLPSGGTLSDHGDRRRRLIALDLVRAALASLTILGTDSRLLVLVLVAAAGSRTASALYEPGRRRLGPIFLPPRLAGAGGSLLTVAADSAVLVGPALGAVLLLVLPPQMLFALDGLTFLISAMLLARVGPQPAPWRAASRAGRSAVREFRRGFDYVATDATTRLFAVQATVGAATASVLQVYFVPLVTQDLHLGGGQVGILYVVVGAAGLFGSATGVRRPMAGRLGIVVAGYIHIVIAILVGLLAGPLALLVALVIFSFSGSLQEVWGLNRIQAVVPEEAIGQAMGVGVWCFFVGRALGGAAAAWGATHMTRAAFLSWFVVVAVVLCVATTVLGGVRRRRRDPATWPPSSPPLPF